MSNQSRDQPEKLTEDLSGNERQDSWAFAHVLEFGQH